MFNAGYEEYGGASYEVGPAINSGGGVRVITVSDYQRKNSLTISCNFFQLNYKLLIINSAFFHPNKHEIIKSFLDHQRIDWEIVNLKKGLPEYFGEIIYVYNNGRYGILRRMELPEITKFVEKGIFKDYRKFPKLELEYEWNMELLQKLNLRTKSTKGQINTLVNLIKLTNKASLKRSKLVKNNFKQLTAGE